MLIAGSISWVFRNNEVHVWDWPHLLLGTGARLRNQ